MMKKSKLIILLSALLFSVSLSAAVTKYECAFKVERINGIDIVASGTETIEIDDNAEFVYGTNLKLVGTGYPEDASDDGVRTYFSIALGQFIIPDGEHAGKITFGLIYNVNKLHPNDENEVIYQDPSVVPGKGVSQGLGVYGEEGDNIYDVECVNRVYLLEEMPKIKDKKK
ncbi:hypothetical protein A3758_16735 [Oleiphilus sp. HI0118]|nr:hypothetical protein A3758_14465 [Oleiphilus sp. HI0118]KZZ51743.1 hypothetical protein A3758_16735 [Oleiphilus sp. HI0118]